MTKAAHLELSEAELQSLASRLNKAVRAGDVILLSGALGAGKSTFARALIQARMADEEGVEDAPSPSYSLIQTYMFSALEIWHADLYRLADESELEELGLLEAFLDAVCIVEWPDRLGGYTPARRLEIKLGMAAADDRRTCSIEAFGMGWEAALLAMNPKKA